MAAERRSGTYAKLVPCSVTKERIAEVVNLVNIENPASVHDVHVTVIYSRKECPDMKNFGPILPIKADGESFDIFPNKDGTNCLVLKLKSYQLQTLHSTLRREYGATHDYPAYIPHLTLSYDYTQTTVPSDDVAAQFKDLLFDMYAVEPLNLEWISNEDLRIL